ncbi:hypothetical protein BT96DRAFT_931168 [Gymnopus androsaceus JB14]|uniref:G domain-containing protein n=1 Tax=Gymnopus androsaceus JB14 TaxID=1447944 RepID=A0A6A4INX1_9AGAR|nr:hypothetical protein BT96DRAFT_931168 [Gymnopus androsaceus JB14]
MAVIFPLLQVKPEPHEAKIPPHVPLSMSSNANASNTATSSNATVKPEPSLDDLLDQSYPAAPSRDMGNNVPQNASLVGAETKKYTVYQSVADISYSPEAALKEGLEMVKSVKAYMAKMNLGSKLRQEVWNRELANLEAQTTPKTLIAVCGATGAGKSSIHNIVPTSGMRACTAVVTEIAYHSKSTIDADVSFLSETEWKQELIRMAVSSEPLIFKSDAGVAWQKVHAVYPNLSQEKLVRMSPDQIIAHEPRVAQVLGSTKRISARNSRVFSEEIAKYIDSKDQSRGKKDKKKKKKDEKSLMDKVRDIAGASKKKDHNAPAFWPLIRQVNVRCHAECLSSGCVLVDLPGVADANAARNNIAKNYMKKASCIWILAPITRAVDDKTARDLLGDAFKMQLKMDGNYDDHAITFIASKTDDISCSEVINALHLSDDPELEAIEDQLDKINDETSDWKKKKTNSDKLIKVIEKELKTLRAIQKEHQDHIEALKNGEDFTPILTGAKGAEKPANTPKKRKNKGKGKKGSPKRRRSSVDSDDEDEDSEDGSDVSSDEDEDSDEDSSSDDSDGSDDEASDSERSDKSDNEDGDSDIEVEGLVEEVTEESIQAKLEQTQADIRAARGRLSEARKEKKDALDHLAGLKTESKRVLIIVTEIFDEGAEDKELLVLSETIRGLKDLDDEVAEERDPLNFDSSVNQRDYDAINLPVFPCSSRDYVRLTNQVKGDGEPTCFSDKASTGIPALQAWCHSLTIASRSRAVKNFYDTLKAFVTSINIFVSGIGGVTPEDRQALQEKWESQFGDDNEDEYGARSSGIEDYADPFTTYLNGRIGYNDLIALQGNKSKVDETGEPVGITPRLNKEFEVLIKTCVEQLQELFKDGLEDKCRVGASLSANSAVEVSDSFAASMHWGTYRATLRRHGDWRRNLNMELLTPFTKNIAASWSKLFETDLLRPFEESVQSAIRGLIEEMENSAAIGLKERVKMQGDLCVAEADVALKQTVAVVGETLQTEQKEISRCLAPHVQNNLIDGYDIAMEEKGKGSVARQKLVFRTYIDERKEDMFIDGADVMIDRLTLMCSSVGEALKVAFKELSKKIEVNLAVLWENAQDDPREAGKRREMMEAVSEILGQAQLWINAANEKAKNASAIAQALQDVDTEMD